MKCCSVGELEPQHWNTYVPYRKDREMTMYHAVMLDETRCEFGVTFEVDGGKQMARDYLRQEYPESQCVQLETEQDTMEREKLLYQRIADELDRDYDSRPFYRE